MGEAYRNYAAEARTLATRARSYTIDDVPITPKTRAGSPRDIEARRQTLDAYQRLAAHMASQRVTQRAETWRTWAYVLGLDDPTQDFRVIQRKAERRLKALTNWGVAYWDPDATAAKAAKRKVKRRADGTLYTVGGGTVEVTLLG